MSGQNQTRQLQRGAHIWQSKKMKRRRRAQECRGLKEEDERSSLWVRARTRAPHCGASTSLLTPKSRRADCRFSFSHWLISWRGRFSKFWSCRPLRNLPRPEENVGVSWSGSSSEVNDWVLTASAWVRYGQMEQPVLAPEVQSSALYVSGEHLLSGDRWPSVCSGYFNLEPPRGLFFKLILCCFILDADNCVLGRSLIEILCRLNFGCSFQFYELPQLSCPSCLAWKVVFFYSSPWELVSWLRILAFLVPSSSVFSSGSS